jgi:hypothetical protein
MPAKSLAAAASISGWVINNDMYFLSQSCSEAPNVGIVVV